MIKLLPKWAYLHSGAYAFSDVDSATTIEQTAKVYKKMQELIVAYNELEIELKNEVDKFTNSNGEELNEFKDKINHIMNNFIKCTETKFDTMFNKQNGELESQSKEIELQIEEVKGAIHFMKDNIEQSMIDLFIELKESGEFSEDVQNILNDLQRVELRYDEVNEHLILSSPLSPGFTYIEENEEIIVNNLYN